MAIRIDSPRRQLLFFALLLLALRGLFLVAALNPAEVAVLDILGVEDPRPVYDPEELIFATTAEAIGEDLGIPARSYRYGFGGGGLITAHLTIPLYSLFGSYYLTYKLIPLVLTLLCGCAWVAIVRAWLGSGPATLFALLFLFAPSTLVRNGLLGLGTHAEALVVLGGTFYAGTRAAQAAEARSGQRWALAAGLLGGLCVFVSYSALPPLLGVGLAALVISRGRPRRAWFSFAAGGVVGLIPWLSAIASGVLGLRVYGQSLANAAPVSQAWTRLQLLFGEGLLANYDVPGGSSARATAGWLFLLVVASGWCAMLKLRRRPIALVILAGTTAHLLAFVLRAPGPGARYLVPVYALFLVAIVYSAELLPRASRWRFAPAGVVVLLGVVAQANTLTGSSFPVLRAPLSGVSWPMLGEAVGARLTAAKIRSLPERVQPFFWIGYGRQAFHSPNPARWRARALAAGAAQREVWRGVGRWWVRERESQLAAKYLRTLPERQRAAFVRGLATIGEGFFEPALSTGDPEVVSDLFAAFDARDRGFLDASLAYSLAVRAAHGTIAETIEIERMADAVLPDERTRQIAAGRALYRDSGGPSGIRFWKPTPGSWLPQAHALLQSGRGPDALWRGVAASYVRDLRLRSPSWMIGGEPGPVALAAELAWITRDLESRKASLFYRAAGEGTAWALATPFVSRPEPWQWELAIPREHREAFRSGLEAPEARIL